MRLILRIDRWFIWKFQQAQMPTRIQHIYIYRISSFFLFLMIPVRSNFDHYTRECEFWILRKKQNKTKQKQSKTKQKTRKILQNQTSDAYPRCSGTCTRCITFLLNGEKCQWFVQKISRNMFHWASSFHFDTERGGSRGDRGSGHPPTLENHKWYRFPWIQVV